jgi:hypothetical protein
VSGDVTASATDARRTSGCCWLVAKRQQARTADSEREWHTHNRSQRFVEVVLLVLVRCAQERSGSPIDDTLSQRELPVAAL